MTTAKPNIEIPAHELSWSYARSSGPGGQNVNKVNSKAILHWHIESSTAIGPDVKARFVAKYGNLLNKEGFVVLASDAYRDQPKNTADCQKKLIQLIISVLEPPKKRIATKPTRTQKAKRLDSKKQNSERKANRRRVNY